MSSFVGELWAFIMSRRKFFLVPIIIVLGLLGALIVLGSGSAITPFIYALF